VEKIRAILGGRKANLSREVQNTQIEGRKVLLLKLVVDFFAAPTIS